MADPLDDMTPAERDLLRFEKTGEVWLNEFGHVFAGTSSSCAACNQFMASRSRGECPARLRTALNELADQVLTWRGMGPTIANVARLGTVEVVRELVEAVEWASTDMGVIDEAIARDNLEKALAAAKGFVEEILQDEQKHLD